MDEKDQKTLTIADILEQLTKPSVIQSQVPLGPISVPKTTFSPLPVQSAESGIRLPELGKKLESSTAVPIPSIGQSPKDIRMSIRTMSADLARLKQGQKPTVFEVKKTALSTQKVDGISPPLSAVAKTPLQTAVPPPIASPPSLQTPAFRPSPVVRSVPSFQPSPRPVSGPLEPRPLPPLPSLSQKKSKEPEHRHPERIISQDSLPSFLGAPVPKKVAKPPEEKVEYGLIARVIGSGMTTGIISTIVVALAIYILLTYFVFNKEDTTVTTPVPTQSETLPTPVINELETIFKAVPADNFSIPDNKEQTVSVLISFMRNKVLVKKELRRINFIPSSDQVKIDDFHKLLDTLEVKYPAELKDNVNTNRIVMLYGQDELFSHAVEVPKRMIFITEVKDTDKIISLIKRWELTMPNDFKNIFELDVSKQASQNFLDNQYRNTSIRYNNFPFPDRSIDYAVVASLTGKQYLIITNSRESIYLPIDKIKGL